MSFVAISQIKNELTQTQNDLYIAQQQWQQNSNNDIPQIPEEGSGFNDVEWENFVAITGTVLKTDLINHPELIPYEGVLWGTMSFYEQEMNIIGDKWVMAYFEDGHIGGYALFTYTGDQNNISWILLDSYIL